MPLSGLVSRQETLSELGKWSLLQLYWHHQFTIIITTINTIITTIIVNLERATAKILLLVRKFQGMDGNPEWPGSILSPQNVNNIAGKSWVIWSMQGNAVFMTVSLRSKRPTLAADLFEQLT